MASMSPRGVFARATPPFVRPRAYDPRSISAKTQLRGRPPQQRGLARHAAVPGHQGPIPNTIFSYHGQKISKRFNLQPPKILIVDPSPVFDGSTKRRKKDPISLVWVRSSFGRKFGGHLERVSGVTGLRQGAKLGHHQNAKVQSILCRRKRFENFMSVREIWPIRKGVKRQERLDRELQSFGISEWLYYLKVDPPSVLGVWV